ncbi:hypothetical protein T4D_13495 [Trichinella pseudospiralis]|uniref:Uncharacterized protein n=1 Tax=Trichinella pseudospiralis TaxID=6337 RepID=A0A0V1DSJ9_TRIPS|nr:hypothetical protein T4D_13495 [Trichinella pseudospiralis]
MSNAQKGKFIKFLKKSPIAEFNQDFENNRRRYTVLTGL